MSLFTLFHLKDTDHQGTIEMVRSGVEFQGTNLWMLVLAMLIASIGLNVNSTAIIIGAMLISPLMGPIAGAGLALGIYDTTLLKRALVNLAIMTVVSLLASAAYFSVTPLQEASAEMLARTKPSFFDVLIAFFGGSAMIIAQSRKSRSSNALAGVAIATALMPPLCTAGYGLAARDWSFFLGALYLYLINSIFIGFATYLFSKYLKLGDDQKLPENMKRNQVLATVAAVLVFVAPSIWFAVDMSQESSFGANARRFVERAMNFQDSRVVDLSWHRNTNPPQIDVTLIGTPISPELTSYLQTLLPEYKLQGVRLNVIQSNSDSAPLAQSPTQAEPQVIPTSPPRKEIPPEESGTTISERMGLLAKVEQEALVAFPGLYSIVWADLLQEGSGKNQAQPASVFTRWDISDSEAVQTESKARFAAWLRLRLSISAIEVY